MISIYLDDCLTAKRMARQLRMAGHSLYLPPELGLDGQDDELHLEASTKLGAVLATQNQKHFAPLHHLWQSQNRQHTGIILFPPALPIAQKIEWLGRAARLLTPGAAHNQLMHLSLFATELTAEAYVTSLTPPASEG